jgi:hypothetical protein
VKDDNLFHLLFTYLSTHMSTNLCKYFSKLFLSLLECNNNKNTLELSKVYLNIIHWLILTIEYKCLKQLKNGINHRICAIPGASIYQSQIVNGVILSHCHFTRNSLKEVKNGKLLFLNTIISEDVELINHSDIICITDNYFGTIEDKMIVKLEDEDFEFLLNLLNVQVGDTVSIQFAQHIVSGAYSHLLVIPQKMYIL